MNSPLPLLLNLPIRFEPTHNFYFKMRQGKKASIIGAGLVGSLWAVFLAKMGYRVEVYEQRSDLRKVGFIGGRSINLALSDRGWKAMKLAGIEDEIRSTAIPMYGRMMHNLEGDLTFQPYGKKGQAIYSVSRGGLNLELINIADRSENVRFHFDQKCKGLDLKNDFLLFENAKTGGRATLESPLIFGADGAFSAVRGSLQKTSRFNFSQDYLEHGYKELSIPPSKEGSHQMEKNALHIWPREQFMLIALPNQDGSFTCTLFLPFEGESSFSNLQTEQQILIFFEKYFPDALALMPTLLEDFDRNPTSSLVTVRCNPWQYQRRVLLIGDAAHAIVPFYGQGMNAGFEDCTILKGLMEQHGDDWTAILSDFTPARITDANAIADLALRNFIEMRDLVADPKFLLRKKIEEHLNNKFSEAFLPVYSMVTFSHLPYGQALQESFVQDELFERILAVDQIEEKWNGEEVESIFRKWLKR